MEKDADVNRCEELKRNETPKGETGVYVGKWNCKADIRRDMAGGWQNQDMSTLDRSEIIFAVYECTCFAGWAIAFVLFRLDGQLYEVNADHCSCFGLEGQWAPEPTDIEILRHRISDGMLGIPDSDYPEISFRAELTSVLDSIEAGAEQ